MTPAWKIQGEGILVEVAFLLGGKFPPGLFSVDGGLLGEKSISFLENG